METISVQYQERQAYVEIEFNACIHFLLSSTATTPRSENKPSREARTVQGRVASLKELKLESSSKGQCGDSGFDEKIVK